AISKNHQAAKNHKAREMSGFFVIMSYHNDATKRMIAVYTKVYPMRFVYINLGTPPIKSLE
ncbi:hypothetical protein ACXK2M_005460, partial [Escherichia coli]|nr:hypothetical protein [Escherichia coli]EFO1741648.1 hypothetical protein [Escherichia coli]